MTKDKSARRHGPSATTRARYPERRAHKQTNLQPAPCITNKAKERAVVSTNTYCRRDCVAGKIDRSQGPASLKPRRSKRRRHRTTMSRHTRPAPIHVHR